MLKDVQEEVEGMQKVFEEKGWVLYSVKQEDPFVLLIMFEPKAKEFVFITFTGGLGQYTEHYVWLHSAESKAMFVGKSPGAYRAAPDEKGFWRFTPEGGHV